MKRTSLFFSILVMGSVLLLLPKPAHALIFLPALILIPIAQLVAFLIGSISLPVVFITFIWSKLFKKSWKRGLLYSAVVLIIVAVISILALHLLNPDRPLF